MKMDIYMILMLKLIILTNVTYNPVHLFVIHNLMGLNSTRKILGFGPHSEAKMSIASDRQFFTPCHDNNDYCETFTGYPREHMERVLKQNAVPKEFFVDDDPPLEVATRWQDQDVTLCSSMTRTIFPTMGKNKRNEWKLIFNDPDKEGYIQSVRVEICQRRGKPCSFTYRYGYRSECQQKYIYRRLVSLGDLGRPAIDMIKLPSGCECVLRKEYGWQPRNLLPQNL